MKNLRVHNTGTAVHPIIFDVGNIGLQQGDALASYFEQDGIQYIIGIVRNPPLNGNVILTSMIKETGIWVKDPSIITGVPSQGIVKLAVIREDKAFVLIPASLSIYTGSQNGIAATEIKAANLTLYHVMGCTIDFDQEVVLNEVPYFQWYSEQCPTWLKSTYETVFVLHRMQTNKLKSSDGSEWETTFRAMNRQISSIVLSRPDGADGVYYELIEGNGILHPSSYTLVDADELLNRVVIRQYANRRENCGLKSDPFVDFIFNFEKLPEFEKTMVKVKDADPIIPSVELVPYAFDEVYGEDTAITVGSVGGKLAFVNRVNQMSSVSLKVVGSTRSWVGTAIPAKSARITNINIQPRDRNKIYDAVWSSSKAGINGAFSFELK